MNIPFLEAPREVTFDWHIVQATKWVEFDAGRELDSVLLYAAVELRAAIERYIFELVYLLKEGKLSADEETRCRSITGVFALMKETDPFYRKTIEFTKLVISLTPGLPEITVVDTAYLNRKWQDLSEYCHMQFRPEETFGSQGRKFQKQGFALLREVLQKFHEWKVESNCAVLARSSLPDEVRDVYDKFIRKEIDVSQAKRMLVLCASDRSLKSAPAERCVMPTQSDMSPAIGLSYTTRIPPDIFTEFERLVAAEGLDLHVEQRDEDGPFAAFEWLVPTAVVVLIGKAYFDGFLKEMGKDHYALLKAGLKSLYFRLLGPSAPKTVVVSAGGKTSTDQPYSLLFSIFAEADEGARFKLLLRRSASESEYEATVEAFLAFLEAYYNGSLAPEIVAELKSTTFVGRTILLVYNPALERVQPIDPVPSRRPKGA